MSEDQVVDLSAYLPMGTADLHVLIPGTNKPLGWVITMAGPGHPKTVALNNDASRKNLRKEQLIEQARANGKRYKGDAVQPEENRREFIESVVARIVDWTPVKLSPDKVYTFSEENAVELLLKPEMAPYVVQIVDFFTEEKSFMKASVIG